MWLKAISNFNAFRSRRYEGDIQDVEEGKERKFKSYMKMRKKRKASKGKVHPCTGTEAVYRLYGP